MEPFDLDIDSSKFTETRIFKAIKLGNHHKVLQAIQTGENVVLQDPEFHSSYLHVVCSLADSHNEEKYVPIVYQLSNAGVDINARDYKGRTALELAIGRELRDTMVALIRCGAELTSKDYKQMIRDCGTPFEYELINAIEKYEPGLWQCVLRNDTSMIHMLTNSWCRVNISRQGVTMLQMARQTHKSPELINVLDDYEVTIEFVHATLAGDEKRMLEFLMDSKPCDPNIMDISYQERWSMPLEPRSLRDTAFCMGHTHILHLLPEDEAEEPPPGGGAPGEARPTRHIRDKGRSDTVMAITSLNGYFPDGGEFSPPLNEISEDEDDLDDGNFDVISVVQDEQYINKLRPSTARSQRYQTATLKAGKKSSAPSKLPALNFTGPKTLSLNSNSVHDNSSKSANGGTSNFTNVGGKNIEMPPGYGEKEYYFHEVDGFVSQYYVEDGSDPPFKTYVCKPDSDMREGRKMMKRTDKRATRSKMCVIS